MNDEAFDEAIENVEPVSDAEGGPSTSSGQAGSESTSDVGGARMSSADIRMEYIDHETSIKSVSYIYYLSAGLGVVMAVVAAIVNKGDKELIDRIFGAMLMSALPVFQAWVGMELRELKRWARVAGGILSGLGCLSIPIGTVIHGYVLYLLFGKKGAEVFSPSYQKVIAETPGVKGKTSVMIWVCMGLTVLLSIIGMLIVIFFNPPVR